MPRTPSLSPHEHPRGATLLEVVTALVLVAATAVIVVPGFGEARGAAELRAATGRISGLMARCRAHAIMHCLTTGLVFEREAGGWRCFIAEDLDGDGIRSADLETGRDRIVSEVVRLKDGHAGLGILHGERVPDPAGGGRLRGDLDDPVRAGRGDIISFTPVGTATPSSVFLTDGRSRMRVVRVYGATGRIRTLVWRSGWPGWRRCGM